MNFFTTKQYTYFTWALLVVSSILFSNNIMAQEICGNGIDDDGDNLIDCADPECDGYVDCSDTFICSSDLFQVTSGTLKVLDPSKGTYNSLGSTSGYNATGYNVQDGYIYGIQGSNPNLVRINNQGQTTVVGAIDNFTGLTYAGDFDTSGNWLSFTSSGGNWVMGTLDVDVMPLTMTATPITNLSTTVPAQVCADISYNAFTGKYYGCKNGIVVEFDPINATVRGLADFSSTAQSGAYGAAWSDIEGNSYFFNNNTGNIYRAEFRENGEIIDFSFIAVSEPNGSNDGMSCPLSNPPVFPEICSNGIDDDGDGLVDCDDPDCTLGSDCGEICDNGIDDDGDGFTDGEDSQCEVSSGNNGGLESNRRLSQLISQRNYKKAIVRPAKLTEISSTNKANGYLENYIPTNIINGSVSLDASPSDLIGITNAIDIFSADIEIENRRVASILAIETQNDVYEHTKYICDRLDGAIINDLKMVDIYNTPFIVAEIIQPAGNVEYAISFNIYPNENGQASIESHWNLDAYPNGSSILNFQLWANDLITLVDVVEGVIDNANEIGQITHINTSDAPVAYVSTGRYENGKLHLRIQNNAGATQFGFEGSFTKTETGEIANFNANKNTYGHSVENITLEVGSIYDVGFRISNNASETVDDLFFADGAWGVDVNENTDEIYSFTVTENITVQDQAKTLVLHRNIALEATTSEQITVYRALTPKFRSKDLSAYNQLEMTIEGAGSVELTMVKSSITQWENQYRTNIILKEQSQKYTINLHQLSANDDEILDYSDVNMLVFKFTPVQGSNEVAIGISDISFGFDETVEEALQNLANYDAELLEKSNCFPNPASNKTNLVFEADSELTYNFTLTNSVGSVIKSLSGTTNNGFNSIELDLSNFVDGIYYYKVATNTSKQWKGKVLLSK